MSAPFLPEEKTHVVQPYVQPESEMSIYSRLLHSGQLEQYRDSLTDAEKSTLPYNDAFWLRPKQLVPIEAIWKIIIMMAGRGWGKTRAGSAWIKQQLFVEGCRHAALVARTHSEAVGIILKEDSGIMNTFPPELQPHWNSQTRELTWPEHDKKATVIYGNEPEQCRGYNFDCAWIDEFAKFQDPEKLWNLLLAALRLKRTDGKRPPALFTTTPQPHPILHEFQRWAANPETALMPVKMITGSTHENQDNVGADLVESLTARYKPGSRQYRQEVEGELLLDIEGAIFTRDMFKAFMPVLFTTQDGWIKNEDEEEIPNMIPLLDGAGLQIINWDQTLSMFSRIEVGVDPSGARDDKSSGDEIGITVGGLLRDAPLPTAVCLWDGTFKDSPAKWGARVVSFYERFKANCIIGEENFGGGMVEHAIKSAAPDKKIPYKDLRATRGKDIRAEEIAQWYENGQVLHLYHLNEDRQPVLARLENQMCHMTTKGYMGEERSPDIADSWMYVARSLLREEEVKKTYAANFLRESVRT